MNLWVSLLHLVLGVVVLEEVISSKAKEAEGKRHLPLKTRDLRSVPFQPAPLLVDPLLCQQLRNSSDTSSPVRARRSAILLDLCDGKSIAEIERRYPAEPQVSRGKRERRKSIMDPKHQKMMLQMHNEFRRITTPQAGDMRYMKWDEYLADTAQMWADRCNFTHGFPEEVLASRKAMGQNLYAGTEYTGRQAMIMWNEEREFYDFETGECEPGEQCGHYVQLVWAESEHVGCGVARCLGKGYMIVCHYRPPGNALEVAPYEVGKPCSQCPSRLDGGLCYKNSCVSSKDCEELNLTCSCDLECQNCAILYKPMCRCDCKPGWDSLDCSRPCIDDHRFCHQDPGWPNVFSCDLQDGKVRDYFCRKMCSQCRIVDPTTPSSKLKNPKRFCCEGKSCESGNVLNGTTCECYQFCPGPFCLDHQPEESEASEGKTEERIEEQTEEKTEVKIEERIEGSTERHEVHTTEESLPMTTRKEKTQQPEERVQEDESLPTPKIATKLSSSQDSLRLDCCTFIFLLSIIVLL
uniref:Cysteine-rich venom protein n=1 Tax=Hemiscolopendra marginata TaxID=943146 RepID=A0A646QDZ8_9MYRI